MKARHKSELSRRAAIGSGLAVLAGGMLGAKPGLAEDKISFPITSHCFSEDMWANLVGNHFRIIGCTDDEQRVKLGRVSLELMETGVVRLNSRDRARPKHLRTETVSLLFRGPEKVKLPSVSYQCFHRATGKIDFLISYTQSKRYRNQNIYEAILN